MTTFPGNALDSSSFHGACQRVVTRKRVWPGHDRVAQAVGFIMIPVADGDGSAGIRTAAHREIARGNGGGDERTRTVAEPFSETGIAVLRC